MITEKSDPAIGYIKDEIIEFKTDFISRLYSIEERMNSIHSDLLDVAKKIQDIEIKIVGLSDQ